MNIIKDLLFTLTVWLFAFTASANTQAVLPMKEVAPGIYFHQGKIDDLFTTQTDPVANITVIIGKEAVAVVDTGGSRRAGEMLYRAIRQITALPIRYVINTHVHPDHNFGNQAFVSEQPQFIAHTRYAGDFHAKANYYQQRLTAPWFEGTTPIAATHFIEKETEIDLGQRTLVLMAHERAHTRHDLTVFDATTRTLIAGDLLFVDHVPSLDGSLTGWLSVINTLNAMPYLRVIPGHGPIQTGKNAFDAQTHYLRSLAQEVRAAINQNIDINTASLTVLRSHADNWKLFEQFHGRNVIQAYKELEWE
ncbi:quinoprotein relay system zinc metallohydrolase 2 [Enterovibrio sp. ZSDZ42]|uniref:Quinoprotein relay system zinc metallohydrolase 2 n=1 Tax=Enterovibrio gelatinilyticus TaxID=2899819 RepID=A0ABT5R2W1_9GAMM|nr:quinoprotein relay system zinc metallohydrolase 2 [Enterovibrio sp. ZSDZ42]MDD1793842.1 quinoprotein relay system zinc metallohydrolase 2 [Enterovibrio sp. ZSDZ42]